MSSLRFKVVEEASNRKAVEVDIPKERPQEYYASKVFNRAKMYEYQIGRASCRERVSSPV